jgi:type III restriction enzyme
MLKNYQQRVVRDIESFFSDIDSARQKFAASPDLQSVLGSPINVAFVGKYEQFQDRPKTGANGLYPRVCIKMPTGGGKTLVAIEAIRSYQNLLAKKRTGLVVWITHRDQIYRQTIENLQNKSHPYRQLLDQASGNRTLIIEKGQSLRQQDVQENLVVLMLMIQSATRDTNKIFEDSGGYMDFFPPENRYDLHAELLKLVPNLDRTEDSLFDRTLVKTSLGNVIRTLNPFIIVDEFHTMWTDIARSTLDGLNATAIMGLSATPKRGMNILSTVTGKDLKAEDMIKLDMHLIPPIHSGDWRTMIGAIKTKRDDLQKKAKKLEQNNGTYIRPIALIQVERTGKDQRGQGLVHSEDVRELLIDLGVPKHEIAVKSSSIDEIKQQKLLSRESEIRYIITKEALKEGWDCSFAYILGVIPNARTNSSMTQLVGRVLRQPYAKKTGVADLDESYVFFATGHTQEVVENVKKGFEDEGLGDVSMGIEIRDHQGNVVNPVKVVSIKKDIRKKYPESLFLPVWLIKDGPRKYRKFSYDIDIKPKISWDVSKLLNKWLEDLMPTIGERRENPLEIVIDLEGKGVARQTESLASLKFDTLYLTRRISETIDNAFISHSIAAIAADTLGKKFSPELLDQNAGYVARELERHLLEHKRKQEQGIFEDLVKSNTLILVVSDDDVIGFEMPQKDIVANTVQAAFSFNLYEDVEIASMNTLEHTVAKIIEQSPNVIWWARNKTQKGWYSIQGWQRNKIRPDFVIARKNEKDELEFVYVIESKGEQLAGNDDTQYKDAVLNRMTAMKGSIEQIKVRATTVKFNDQFEFELVPQGDEERRIRTKTG